MYCSNCGKEIPKESDFCPYCGTDLKEENSIEKSSKSENIICGIAIGFFVLIIIGLIYYWFQL